MKIEQEERKQEVSEEDHIPEDYISAAAAVVEAARKLDETHRKTDAAYKALREMYDEKDRAEKGLQQALEKLKQASTGRMERHEVKDDE